MGAETRVEIAGHVLAMDKDRGCKWYEDARRIRRSCDWGLQPQKKYKLVQHLECQGEEGDKRFRDLGMLVGKKHRKKT